MSKTAQIKLEERFKNQSMGNRQSMLEYGDLQSLCELLMIERNQLRRAIEKRNDIEGKAHRLFTEPLIGQTFLHRSDQCNPLGFVEILRNALLKSMQGKKLANPFIFNPKEPKA